MMTWREVRRRRSATAFSGRREKRARRCCGLTMKDIITLLSSLALPLVLGVFTAIITFDQRDIAGRQRLEDRRLGDEQRDQDLNISREQRLEDRELAREQRLQDLNQSIVQRALERTIADETRNISVLRQKHELEIEEKRHRDSLLTSYISEVSNIIEKNNGSVTSTSLMAVLLRSKTLTLIPQLEPNRNRQVIRFLYEAGQLNAQNQSFVDLSDAELSDIDLGHIKPGYTMHHLHLSGVDLTGSSFFNRNLTGSNFSYSKLGNANFSFTILTNVDFSYAKFDDALHMRGTVCSNINFAHADLGGIDFTKSLLAVSEPSQFSPYTHLHGLNFTDANLTNTRFAGLYLTFVHFRAISHSIDFFNTTLMSVMFENVNTHNLNFSYSKFIGNVTFLKLRTITNSSFFMAELISLKFTGSGHVLDNLVFDFAKLTNVHIRGSTIKYSSFINATLKYTFFTKSELWYCTLVNITMSQVALDVSMMYVTLDDAILQDRVVFSASTIIDHGTFRRAQMQGIKAEHCKFLSVNMNEANLSNARMFASHLKSSDLTSADFTGADISMVDLSQSNMFNARITDEQLHSALTIENSTLPNGTIGHDFPLIRNGDAHCDRSADEGWIVQPSNSIILIKSSISDDAGCMFVAVQPLTKNNSVTRVTMTQRVNVTRYSRSFNEALTELYLTSDCNTRVNITVIERDTMNLILSRWMVRKDRPYSTPRKRTTSIEIKLEFDTSGNGYATCDNIKFSIDMNRD